MTRLRKMMLEELQRRNYAQTTVEAYTLALRQFAEYFHRPPDQLGPEHVREFQLHLLRDKKLAANTVKQRMAAGPVLLRPNVEAALFTRGLSLPESSAAVAHRAQPGRGNQADRRG